MDCGGKSPLAREKDRIKGREVHLRNTESLWVDQRCSKR